VEFFEANAGYSFKGTEDNFDLNAKPGIYEFLTHKTTCANVMSKRTTCENICQKRPPLGSGTSGQATRGMCRLGRRRHGHAATANAGMWPGSWLRRAPLGHEGPAASPISGMVTWLPAAIPVADTLARPTGPSSNDDGADY
jgi:hypothetical protein